MKYTLILIAALSSLIGCKSQKSASNVTPIDPAKLNGSYVNHSSKFVMEDAMFWSHITPFARDSTFVDDSYFNVKVIDDRKIRFELYQADTLSLVRNTKYKIDRGNVVVTKNRRLRGVPLIFFRGHHEDLKLSLDENSNLKMIVDGYASGGVLVVIFGVGLYGDYIFQRKDTLTK